MHNRFNRPFDAAHVEALIFKLREAAMLRQSSDPAAADVIFKALHTISTLWRECALHDKLMNEAEQTLNATEARLRECLDKLSIEPPPKRSARSVD